MEEPTFEENLAQLEEIVKHLESGNVPLEEALEQFKVGVGLSNKLQKTLRNAENSLTKIIDDNNQELPFKPEEGK
ncbi:exodeoxyribonuclease VII small subunit [Weissella beninensis]|uniref:Exodeoxyribonuclease 7 small subunit n=1 Tax=Periweissella beninensis TaxID=504936 RepID=A0ABT0VIE7_9LACO|nr:exodeoxyribonuclease VII small subunit [Periweissella beninensis]MBM7544011.1 exodeoxyribonuclease VII small subunit [Periweissella beninensis]MCM2437431.1 exodeoxyribonuclease VII small subunit [Periweissella beninensis]